MKLEEQFIKRFLRMKNKILLILLLICSISYSQQIERIEPLFWWYTKEQIIEDITRKTAIDLSRQKQGTYIVVMESKTLRQTFKIIRE